MFHQSFYPQSQQPPSPPFLSSRKSNHFFMPGHSYFSRPGPIPNQSTHNLNFSRDFEHFSMPHYGFAYPFFDTSNQNYNQQRWRNNIPRGNHQQQHRQIPAFYSQDKSTFYYMSDPIVTNDDRITIQLTKVHIGPNGDQQRVLVEQEFSNENELNKFVKNLRHNFKKTFNNRATGVDSSDENQNTNSKKPGVIVVEEPDEEPKIYEQKIYNENIEPAEIKYDGQRSCSTIRSNRHKKNKTKYRRQKTDNYNEQQSSKSSRIFQTPSYSRHYQQPPRFQQRVFNKENDFNVPPNAHWRYSQGLNEYPHPSRFQYFNEPIFHPSTPPRFRHRRNHQQPRPTTIAENLVFTNNKQQQGRVNRTRSNCQQNVPRQTHECRADEPILQRHFIPIVLTSSVFYPQRRFVRNTQIQLRLFNPHRLGSNRF